MWDFKMILGILSVSDVSGPWARGPEKGRESAGWGQSSNLMAKVPCHVRSVHFQSWTTVHPWRPRTACPRQRLDQDAQWSWATKKHVSSKITEDIHFSSLVFFLQALNCLWSTHIHYWNYFIIYFITFHLSVQSIQPWSMTESSASFPHLLHASKRSMWLYGT